MSDLATALIEREEGCVLQAYKDSLGLWTIGYGHLLPEVQEWAGYSITQEKAEEWLQTDMEHARSLATGFPHYADCNEVRQAVLVSMCYQLGDKPLHWPHFMAALEDEDYAQAAVAGLDSDWARTQTPARAKLEMAMLESGLWELT